MTFKDIVKLAGGNKIVAEHLGFSKVYIARLYDPRFAPKNGRAFAREGRRLLPLLEARRAELDAAIHFIKEQPLV